jgi:ubiquinone/menaquinone biosynthesis C-methylase UbiE
MSASPRSSSEYVLGSSEQERQRLQTQAGILRGWTETIFRAAGIEPGMSVLDVGCGVGDVSFLAAEFVGPTGTVLGIDRDGAALERARERAPAQSLGSVVRFEQADLSSFVGTTHFDAVVGRYILLYQSEPAATLRHLAGQVRSGGLLVFHELEFSELVRTWPTTPLWDQTMQILAETFRRSNAAPDFGLRLVPAFREAGLPWPGMHCETAIGCGPGSYLYGWLAETVRAVLPRIEQFDVARAESIDIDTLQARLEAECLASNSQIMGPVQVGAWVRKP